MAYQQWVDLFGKAADDPLVRDAVAKAGITKKLKIGRDELSVSADIPGSGMTIHFTDESILKQGSGAVAGRPVLTSVLMILQHPSGKNLYSGPLPFQLDKRLSRADLRAKLGAPLDHDDEMRWDTWVVDNLGVTATYAKDFSSINRLALKLPGTD